MSPDSTESQVLELSEENIVGSAVCFDSENVILTGIYRDQLSAFRAKKAWTNILETNFFLEFDHDFCVKSTSEMTSLRFVVKAQFNTACARYAFWRLTNNQAPEVQYMIETAHIPHCQSRSLEFLVAPDMFGYNDSNTEKVKVESETSLKQKFAKLVSRLANMLSPTS